MTQASSQSPTSWGQHLAVTPRRALVFLIRPKAVLKSFLATASHIPRTSICTGQASMHTGVPHRRQRFASSITCRFVYEIFTSEKSFFRFSGSVFGNGKGPTRFGSTCVLILTHTHGVE